MGNYRLSFTTGGLFFQEAIKVAPLWMEFKDWDAVSEAVFAQNLLQSRTKSAGQRKLFELKGRLTVLTADQLDRLIYGARQEQDQVLWLAACKQYALIHEFAVEVLHEKFLRLDDQLDYRDFDVFFSNKAEWNPSLEELTISTRKKLRQVLFRMLRQASLLSRDNHILPCLLAPEVVQVIAADDPAYFSIFPTFSSNTKPQAAA
jgi:hypothetical protein